MQNTDWSPVLVANRNFRSGSENQGSGIKFPPERGQLVRIFIREFLIENL
jgi:hypothetical protein